MPSITTDNNRLYADGVEILEWACHQDGSPAHYHTIVRTGISPNGRFVFSLDTTGSLKIWNLRNSRLNQRVHTWAMGEMGRRGFGAVGLSDDGHSIAIAIANNVRCYMFLDHTSADKTFDETFDEDFGLVTEIIVGKTVILKNDKGRQITPKLIWVEV